MKTAEEACESKDKRIEEIQRLLEGMEQESSILRETIRNREEELYELRQIRQEGQKGEQRYANTHTHTHLEYIISESISESQVRSVF